MHGGGSALCEGTPRCGGKAKVGDLVIVLLPLSEELRHKKGEKDQGYWVWEGGKTADGLWE